MNTQTERSPLKSGVKDAARKIKAKALNGEVKEGSTTKAVETVTAKIPSLAWLGFAVASMAASAVIIGSARKKEYGNFVGMWAPSFMLIGIYNKLVKLEKKLA